MTTTSTPDTITITTEEGHEVTMPQADYAVLKAWPRLDVSRLVVVGDDAVHARRTDGTVHPQSLEALLELVAVPAPLPAAVVPVAEPVAAPAHPVPPVPLLDSKGRQTTPEALARVAAHKARANKERAERERSRKPRKATEATQAPEVAPLADVLQSLVGKTGEAKPDSLMLKPKGFYPTVILDGVPTLVNHTFSEGDRVKVPLTRLPDRAVVAWAYLPATTHEMLRCARWQIRTLVWSQDDRGRPTTSYKGNNSAVLVSDILTRLGLDPALLEVVPVVEPVAA